MIFSKATTTLGLASVLVLAGPVATYAQETTSAIRGKVISVNGSPLDAASIDVIDSRTGIKRSYSTNSSGTFFASRLPVGGPYKVVVNGDKTIMVDSIALGDTFKLAIDLSGIEEVVVTAEQLQGGDVAPGPSATFGAFELETSVAINRDIADVYAMDPRMNIDSDDDGFSVNCGGKHPRFNSVTLDGVSQNDRFGLNENGYSTAVGMPFPFDGISQVSVSLAPFDVTYGGFSACNINAVTKSGSNEWDGGVFYEYSSDDLKGTTLGDAASDQSGPAYTESKKGFHIGGPLIEDKLFIFAAYEESEKPRFLQKGYAGSGNGVERDWLSQSDYNRIVDIANNVYNYDAGGQPGNGTQESEKYMVRLDWNINEDHNLAVIYNYFDGFQLRDSDGDSNEFEFANHYYTKGSESETFTMSLSSQWTDALSTEIFYSTNEMNDSQVTVGDPDFGDMQISIGGRTGTVYLGADDSRQANALNTESKYFKFSAKYLVGEHLITAGFDSEELTVFNQFVQHSNGGEYDYFDSSSGNSAACDALSAQGRADDDACGLSGIDRFELGTPSRIYYGSGGGTNNPDDAAANFVNTINSVYIQDELYLSEQNLTITAGLRYEYMESDDRPNFNQAFFDANGVRNDANVDGIDIIMPRLGFTWEYSPELTVRGGLGLYSGGNPNVWISNAWSNDGATNVQLRNSYGSDSVLSDIPLSGSGRPGYDVPQDLVDEVAATTIDNASSTRIALLDPNYKQPSEWKFALGASYDLPWGGVQAEIDYLHTETKDSAIYLDLSQEIVGNTIDGMPIYDYVNGEDNHMLTNSSEDASSDSISIVLKKSFDWGLDLQMGYAYIDAEDVAPMTSSTAGSNWDATATSNPNDLTAATSNYTAPHRFTARASYATELFADLTTRITLMAYSSEGQPQSYVMGSGDLEGDGFYGRHLLYVPTGADDPNVVFEDGFDSGAFFSWARAHDLDAGYVQRNETHAPWSTRMDLRIDQELPTFVDGTKGKIYFKMYNLGNFLNDEWGHVNDAQFFSVQMVESSVNSNGQYVFEEFNDTNSITDLKENPSLWTARIGLEFEF